MFGCEVRTVTMGMMPRRKRDDMKTMIVMMCVAMMTAAGPTMATSLDDGPAATAIIDDNFCDPLYDWECGYAPIPGGGYADIGGELLNQSVNHPSSLYEQWCTGTGSSTTCQGNYTNGYHVHCYLQQGGSPGVVWCSYTPPPTDGSGV